jgi:hypothetical protein
MAVNRDKPDRWKADIEQSADMYNNWFTRFAPEAYRTTRFQTTIDVKATLEATENLTDIDVELLRANPSLPAGGQRSYDNMEPGTFSFRMNVRLVQQARAARPSQSAHDLWRFTTATESGKTGPGRYAPTRPEMDAVPDEREPLGVAHAGARRLLHNQARAGDWR